MKETRKSFLPEIRTLIFEKICVEAQTVLAEALFVANHLDLTCQVDQVSQELLVCLRSVVLGKKVERLDVEERWPADWWQAFRERWFPRWWLRRWPVRYRYVSIHRDIYRVCPHVNIKTPSGNHVHFEYLEGSDL